MLLRGRRVDALPSWPDASRTTLAPLRNYGCRSCCGTRRVQSLWRRQGMRPLVQSSGEDSCTVFVAPEHFYLREGGNDTRARVRFSLTSCRKSCLIFNASQPRNGRDKYFLPSCHLRLRWPHVSYFAAFVRLKFHHLEACRTHRLPPVGL